MLWVMNATGQLIICDCALSNAMPDDLHNWKVRVMQQTKCCNNIVMTSASERKINEQIKAHDKTD